MGMAIYMEGYNGIVSIYNEDVAVSGQLDFTILYALEGKAKLYTENTIYTLNESDIFIVNSLQDWKVEMQPGKSLIASIYIDYSYISNIVQRSYINVTSLLISRDNPTYSELQSTINKLLILHASNDNLDQIQLKSEYYTLLYKFTKYLINPIDDKHKSNAPLDIRTQEIIRYINLNYSKPISLRDIADKFYLSVPYLSKLLREELGINYLEYLNGIRARHGKIEVERTRKTITQIAYDNGFNNIASFNKAFKTVFGMTPSIMRNNFTHNDHSDENQRLANYLSKRLQIADDKRESDVFEYYANALSGRAYERSWNKIINIGLASEIINPAVQREITNLVNAFSFKYGHIWQLFCRETLVDPTSDSPNFTVLDGIIDYLLNNNIIPSLDVGFRKRNIVFKSNNGMEHLGNYNIQEITSIPLDKPSQYHRLITLFIKHCISRYGKSQVEAWRFSIHYDQNIPISGNEMITWASIFNNVSNAIRDLLPHTKIGIDGIPTFDSNHILEEYMISIYNNEIKPDYLGIAIYPYDHIQDDTVKAKLSLDNSYINHKIQSVKILMNRYGLSDIPLLVTEWDCSHSNRNYIHDSVYKCAYIVKNILECADQVPIFSYCNCFDSMYVYYDTNSMLFGAPGLITRDAIKKPSYYAFMFLRKLKNKLIKYDSNCVITTDEENNYSIICQNIGTPKTDYYYEDSLKCDQIDKLFSNNEKMYEIHLTHVEDGNYHVEKMSINHNSGNLMQEWIDYGKVTSTSNDSIQYLSDIAIPHRSVLYSHPVNGELTIFTTLQTNEVQLIEISKS